jgi:hypothetical protein
LLSQDGLLINYNRGMQIKKKSEIILILCTGESNESSASYQTARRNHASANNQTSRSYQTDESNHCLRQYEVG